jgi:hypothetical protein
MLIEDHGIEKSLLRPPKSSRETIAYSIAPEAGFTTMSSIVPIISPALFRTRSRASAEASHTFEVCMVHPFRRKEGTQEAQEAQDLALLVFLLFVLQSPCPKTKLLKQLRISRHTRIFI